MTSPSPSPEVLGASWWATMALVRAVLWLQRSLTSCIPFPHAGKTTILRNLAGRHIHPTGAVKVLGRESFHDTTLNFHRVYMGCDWGRRTVAFAGYG